MAAQQFRLPVIKSPEDVEKLSHLTEDEKKLATGNLRKLPPTDGWWILGNDPELQAFWQLTEREWISLLAPDFQGIPFSPLNLITLRVARLLNCEYLFGVLVQSTISGIALRKLEDGAQTKLHLLDYPDSSAWTEEESLSLRFAQACLERKMTDEIFEQAVATWGKQKTLRHLSWVAYVNQWVILEEALGMRYAPAEMELSDDNLTPDTLKMVQNVMEQSRQGVRKLWDELPSFF